MTLNINRILASRPVTCRYGAPMGMRNCNDSTSPLLLQRIRFVDGDYSADGVYWGGGSPLWCAFNAEDDQFAPAMGSCVFVRADDRAEALAIITSQYAGIKFRRAS